MTDRKEFTPEQLNQALHHLVALARVHAPGSETLEVASALRATMAKATTYPFKFWQVPFSLPGDEWATLKFRVEAKDDFRPTTDSGCHWDWLDCLPYPPHHPVPVKEPVQETWMFVATDAGGIDEIKFFHSEEEAHEYYVDVLAATMRLDPKTPAQVVEDLWEAQASEHRDDFRWCKCEVD